MKVLWSRGLGTKQVQKSRDLKIVKVPGQWKPYLAPMALTKLDAGIFLSRFLFCLGGTCKLIQDHNEITDGVVRLKDFAVETGKEVANVITTPVTAPITEFTKILSSNT